MRAKGRKLVGALLMQAAGEDVADYLDLGILLPRDRAEKVIDICAVGVHRQVALERAVMDTLMATCAPFAHGCPKSEPSTAESAATAQAVVTRLTERHNRA
jgi:hypothetical protein